jgi:hypothetical protein
LSAAAQSATTPARYKKSWRAAGYLSQAIRYFTPRERGNRMNGIIYFVGLVVVIIAVLSFFGLR